MAERHETFPLPSVLLLFHSSFMLCECQQQLFRDPYMLFQKTVSLLGDFLAWVLILKLRNPKQLLNASHNEDDALRFSLLHFSFSCACDSGSRLSSKNVFDYETKYFVDAIWECCERGMRRWKCFTRDGSMKCRVVGESLSVTLSFEDNLMIA